MVIDFIYDDYLSIRYYMQTLLLNIHLFDIFDIDLSYYFLVYDIDVTEVSLCHHVSIDKFLVLQPDQRNIVDLLIEILR